MKFFLFKGILLLVVLIFLGCESFTINGSMCNSLQPGQVSTDCRVYNENEAAKASLPIYNENGKCLNCDEPKAVEISR